MSSDQKAVSATSAHQTPKLIALDSPQQNPSNKRSASPSIGESVKAQRPRSSSFGPVSPRSSSDPNKSDSIGGTKEASLNRSNGSFTPLQSGGSTSLSSSTGSTAAPLIGSFKTPKPSNESIHGLTSSNNGSQNGGGSGQLRVSTSSANSSSTPGSLSPSPTPSSSSSATPFGSYGMIKSSSDVVSVLETHSEVSKLRFTITSSVPVHSATEKEFTAFLVTIISPDETEHRTILRRYRQFAALHESISKAYPDIECPHFPKKRLIGNMSQQVIEKRRRKLEAYLQFVSKLPNIDELLGFVTFLGADLSQRGVHKKKGLAMPLDKDIDESYRETDKEREQRVAAERRYNEVKYYVSRLDSCLYKLESVELSFETVYETIDFVIHSEYSKLVVVLGKYLGNRPLSPDFVPRELSKEKEEAITNVKIRNIRQKIIPAISELVSKLRDIKDQLLDVTFPMDQVLDLTHIIEDIQDIFDESNLVPKSLGFRIEAGATHYEAITERWPDYIEQNVYWYKTQFQGHDHIIAFNGDRAEGGAVTVALKPERLEENYGEFRMFVCTRDGNDCSSTKVHFSRLQTEWRDRFADILTAADNRLRGIEWSTCSSVEGEQFLVDHEKKDMRITRRLKFGILLCLKDQEKEEDMFGNYITTPALEYFLEGMGTKTELAGYSGFAGGLDVKGSNTTGLYSYTRNWEGIGNSGNFQLMYHVSTMLPHGEQDQNLAKKRHIGNDIVAIVFQEDGSKPFQATTIKSNYLQIIIVVRAINLGEGRWAWRVTVSNAQDVPEYGPPLPYPPLFTDRDVLCKWLIHKMVNGELAAYRSKLFVQQFRNTWKTLVTELVTKFPSKKGARGHSKSKDKPAKKK